MSKKKKSPILDMTGQILDEIQEHNVLVRGYKENFIAALEVIEWNLIKSGAFATHNSYIGQALGYTRGALMMFGKRPQQ